MGMPDTQQGLNALGSDENIGQIIDVFFTINYGLIIFTFIFFFIGGYLLYAALFAAIGSAVDNEADTQQFMLPVTIPLIFSIIIGLSFVLNNPDGSVAYWLSLFPNYDDQGSVRSEYLYGSDSVNDPAGPGIPGYYMGGRENLPDWHSDVRQENIL
jgi:hypothetical protein